MQRWALDSTSGAEIYEGEVSWYTEEGKLQSMITYKNVEQFGKFVSYDDKGRVLSEMFYKEGGSYDGKMYYYKDKEYPFALQPTMVSWEKISS